MPLIYGVLAYHWWWPAFVAIVWLAARFGRLRGMVAGQFAIAFLIAALHWLHAEMDRPGWNGVPDQDIVFMIGTCLRALLVNVALLPVSALALRTARLRLPPPCNVRP